MVVKLGEDQYPSSSSSSSSSSSQQQQPQQIKKKNSKNDLTTKLIKSLVKARWTTVRMLVEDDEEKVVRKRILKWSSAQRMFISDDEEEDEEEAVVVMGPDDLQNQDQDGDADDPERPFRCSVSGCRSRFKKQGHLNHHTRRVHGARRFKCSECDYRSKTKVHLRQHIATHFAGDERLFVCDRSGCSASFKTAQHLSQHLPKVHGPKKFACQLCDYRATTSGDLRRHVEAVHHDGQERLFVCDRSGCSASFKTAQHLSQHLRKVHGPKQFGCQLCDYRATRSGDLRKHVEAVHHDVDNRPHTYQKS
eukprot:TRINITY_DN68070_c1_g1_i10.p1 TRINITY_DN68070_c1_g1~~TRINITY_DN68070_c1_g1_i10.p1  ORF type:complete len:350 (-),score=119.35 TRINITY_DN68070_c1_g1_i10:87-1004(-)